MATQAGAAARRSLPWLLLAATAVLVGILNHLATDDVQPVAAVLLLAGFGFTLWRPRRAVLFVLLLWLAVPLSSLAGYATNHHPGLVRPHPLYETLVALIPVAVGAGVAAAVRLLSRLPVSGP